MAKATGRPKLDINWEQLAKIAAFPLRQEDIAWILNMSVDTIARAIRKKFKLTFAEYMDQKQSSFRLSLMQKQYQTAMNGNVSMLIWLGKQYLGQKEKQVFETEKPLAQFNLNYSLPPKKPSEVKGE